MILETVAAFIATVAFFAGLFLGYWLRGPWNRVRF
jgi:hypothetical protein